MLRRANLVNAVRLIWFHAIVNVRKKTRLNSCDVIVECACWMYYWSPRAFCVWPAGIPARPAGVARETRTPNWLDLKPRGRKRPEGNKISQASAGACRSARILFWLFFVLMPCNQSATVMFASSLSPSIMHRANLSFLKLLQFRTVPDCARTLNHENPCIVRLGVSNEPVAMLAPV